MPTASEAHRLAEECDRLVATAANPENRALLLKIARLWRDVAWREEAVESGQAVAIGERAVAAPEIEGVPASSHAEALLLKSRARHWRRKATELRHMADQERAPTARSSFARLANNYDGLADQAELTALNLSEAEAV